MSVERRAQRFHRRWPGANGAPLVSGASVLHAAPVTAIDFEIGILGAGFSGMGAAIELRKRGFRDLALLERADEVGGTWRDNTYPGLCVDIPSPKYSYRFEPNPDWSRLYAPGAELQAYAVHCADKYGLRPRIRFGHRVERCVYEEADTCWRLEIAGRDPLRCRYLVSATGIFADPKLPEIPGIESFEGKLIHAARWDAGHDLGGERVAVVGTGATAVQLVPAIVDHVARLDVYQRTPIWLLPKVDGEISERWKRIFRRVPLVQRALRGVASANNTLLFGIGLLHYKQVPGLFRWIERQCLRHLHEQIEDPVLREKLTPDYSFFCKRPGISNDYYPVFNRDEVELVTDPIREITEHAVVTEDGKRREIDTLICATGYAVAERGAMPSCPVYGRDGVELGELWARTRYRAFHGVSVPGYPNFFMMFGPYGTTSPSWFDVIETQSTHLLRCLEAARRRGATRVEVKEESYEADFAAMLRLRESSVLFAGNCASARSYYFDEHGDTPLLRPVSWARSRLASRWFRLDHYDFSRA